MRAEFAKSGRVWLRGAADAKDLARLAQLCPADGQPGKRIAAAAEIAVMGWARALGAAWPGMRPVRVVGFNKVAGSNWAVPWHQDRVIAVRDRAELPGYGNWSRKGGVWHCEPPQPVLERMLFVRVHLDETGEEDGAMEFAPGSHAEGLVAAEDAARVAAGYRGEFCLAAPGDVLILPMLVLHRSRVSKTGRSRRVLRVDFADADLPPPLEWTEAQEGMAG